MNKKYEKIKVDKSKLYDIFELAPNLRADDVRETQALGRTPLGALLHGYIYSEKCYTARYKGNIVAMFGVSGYDMPKNFATIWFLGSDEMLNHPVAFLKEGRKYINEFLEMYVVLVNAVDSRNKTHIDWIRRTGMKISGSVFINGYEFLQFYKIKQKGEKNV